MITSLLKDRRLLFLYGVVTGIILQAAGHMVQCPRYLPVQVNRFDRRSELPKSWPRDVIALGEHDRQPFLLLGLHDGHLTHLLLFDRQRSSASVLMRGSSLSFPEALELTRFSDGGGWKQPFTTTFDWDANGLPELISRSNGVQSILYDVEIHEKVHCPASSSSSSKPTP